MLSLLQQWCVPNVAANAFDPVQILFVFELPYRDVRKQHVQKGLSKELP